MGTKKTRGLVMALVGFSILIYNSIAYITGIFHGLPALTIFGLISVAVGLKMWRSDT
ncbi:hypothetical protein [Acidaminobacter sp.]|uniref:hypothetical protein n=1 Tax=Acidaminobacter sp. TaxID=1872102 RepID=UPI00137F9696|nr:hypothetical protein [Acidaminobacter sp.]MDK9711551.1 hypothetical protein [Acidaminobacter sp.]MZQ96336.1 hypothetical protein [Acidaminobacter sp.]